MLRLGCLGIAGSEHDDGAHAACGALLRDRLDRLACGSDDDAVWRFWQSIDTGITRPAGELGIFCINLVERPIKRLHVGDNATAEGVRPLGGAGHGDASRRHQTRHLLPRVKRTLQPVRFRHCGAVSVLVMTLSMRGAHLPVCFRLAISSDEIVFHNLVRL